MNSFYSEEELKQLGFKNLGNNVLISRKASIYSACEIEIGDNVRIDDFSILSGKIIIKNNVHISAYVALYGGTYGITFHDFSGASARTTIYAMTDDFSGEYLSNSVVKNDYRNVLGGPVDILDGVQIGASCVVLPNVTIGRGSAIGAMSLVNKDIPELSIYAGIPCKKLKDRSHKILELMEEYNE